MRNKITAIALIGSIMGLICELSALFMPLLPSVGVKILTLFKSLSPNIFLSFIDLKIFRSLYFGSQIDGSLFNLAIYLLFFSGAILFIASRAKEIRLLRMAFSLIILTNIVQILSKIFYLSYPASSHANSFVYITIAVSTISSIAWIILSYYALKELSKGISVLQDDTYENLEDSFIDASKSQRFMHHLLDFILSILVVSPLYMNIILPIATNGGSFLFHIFYKSEFGLVLIILISRFTYLAFFEILFGSTPAKYLSGTRVIIEDENKRIGLKTGLIRTLVRFVPFEPISFLFDDNGWHDRWSKTRVVKEENKGVAPKKYLWILVLFIGLIALSIAGHYWYEKYDSYRYHKGEFDKKTEQILSHIDQLTTEHFIILDNADKSYRYSSDMLVLKPEWIEGDSLICSFFQTDEYTTSNIEAFYESHKYSFYDTEIRLAKDQLYASVERSYDNYDEFNIKGCKLFPDADTEYFIEKIFKAYEPNIKIRGTGGYILSDDKGLVYMDLENDGHPAKLIALENIEGDLEFRDTLPMDIESNKDSWQKITLEFENFDFGRSYKFKITVVDQLGGREQEYIISGINNKNEIERIK